MPTQTQEEFTEFLFNQFPPSYYILDQQSDIHVPIMAEKTNKTKTRFEIKATGDLATRGQERLAHSARISESQKVKGNYHKNSNLPCAIGLWWLVYNKQNRFNLPMCQF